MREKHIAKSSRDWRFRIFWQEQRGAVWLRSLDLGR
jgi:hypothetical protein